MKLSKLLALLGLASSVTTAFTGCESDGGDHNDRHHRNRAATTTTTTVEESRVVPATTHETRVERY